MKRSLTTAVAAAATIAIAASGCGSSNDSGGSSTASSSSEPIKVLAFGEITGVGPNPQPAPLDGVKAAVNAFNDAGGVAGRKIQLIECDTKLKPAVAAGCVADAKKQGAIAAIPYLEILDAVTTPLLEKQGIPILGANPTSARAQYSQSAACFVPGQFVLAPQAAAAMGDAGNTSISMMTAVGVGNTEELNQATTISATEHGAKVKFVPVAPTATNFSSIVAQATADGETATYVSALPPGLFSIMGGLAQANPKMQMFGPGYVIVEPAVLGGLDKVPPAKGMQISNYSAFPMDETVPGIKKFREEITKINKAEADSSQALMGYIAGMGATQIIAAAKGDVTAQSVTDAMKSASVSFDGILPDWKYAYNTIGLGCVTNDQVYTGEYAGGTTIKPLNDGKPVTGLSQSVIDYYKKAFAKYAQ
jgi:ABC-type branched-subunit amino acid transport system substrate-binding protein